MKHRSGPWYRAIKECFTFLYRACILPTSADEDAARREYILNVILVSSIMMLLVLDGLIFYHTLLHGQDYLGVSLRIFSALLLFFVLLHILSRRGHFVISSYLLVATLFISNACAMGVWDVNLPVVLLASAFVICVAGILLGTAFGFTMTALTTCLIMVIWHLHISGIIAPQQQNPTEDDVIVFIIFYFLIMAVSWLSNREIEKSLTRARKSEAALKEERNLLEVRVVERTDELRRVQFEEIQQVHRFAEFGKLASGLFHDLLNLLNAISLRTEGNAAEETSLAAAYSTTREIQQFMHAIQKQLGEKNVRKSFSLIEGIEQAIQLIAHKANKEKIDIIFLHDTKEPFVYSGIPFKFHQIIINLLSNAIDAYYEIPDKGSEPRTITIHANLHDRMFVISVEDHGCGIPEGMQKRIFEPFFTTKDKIRGSGIGLATIKKIIEEDFCGTIEVESVEHTGATFTVKFPMSIPPTDDPIHHYENPTPKNNPTQK